MADTESETKAPIPYEWNSYNPFPTMFIEPAEFEKFVQSVLESKPAVMAGSGFCVVPFHWGRGASRANCIPCSAPGPRNPPIPAAALSDFRLAI
jgi:hypothetical protein